MYRLLVEQTNPNGALGDANELSPFRGYAAQLEWLQASGRLGDGDAIATTSWWGAYDYALGVIPYAAAIEHDLVPRVSLDTTGFAPAMPHWHGAFHRMIALDREADLEPLRFAVWRAHLASIEVAVARHRRELAALPDSEQRFARGWLRMDELFAAAAVRTDRVRPSQMVMELGDRATWRWPAELAVWRRMMRTRAARDDVDTLLAGMFGRDWRGRLRALSYAVR